MDWSGTDLWPIQSSWHAPFLVLLSWLLQFLNDPHLIILCKAKPKIKTITEVNKVDGTRWCSDLADQTQRPCCSLTLFSTSPPILRRHAEAPPSTLEPPEALPPPLGDTNPIHQIFLLLIIMSFFVCCSITITLRMKYKQKNASQNHRKSTKAYFYRKKWPYTAHRAVVRSVSSY